MTCNPANHGPLWASGDCSILLGLRYPDFVIDVSGFVEISALAFFVLGQSIRSERAGAFPVQTPRYFQNPSSKFETSSCRFCRSNQTRYPCLTSPTVSASYPIQIGTSKIRRMIAHSHELPMDIVKAISCLEEDLSHLKSFKSPLRQLFSGSYRRPASIYRKTLDSMGLKISNKHAITMSELYFSRGQQTSPKVDDSFNALAGPSTNPRSSQYCNSLFAWILGPRRPLWQRSLHSMTFARSERRQHAVRWLSSGPGYLTLIYTYNFHHTQSSSCFISSSLIYRVLLLTV